MIQSPNFSEMLKLMLIGTPMPSRIVIHALVNLTK